MKTTCSLIAASVLNLISLAYSEEIKIELGPDTKDVWFSSVYNRVQGVNDHQIQTGGWGDSYRFLIQPNLSQLPKKADTAILWLYCFDRKDTSTTVGMNVYRVTSPWNEYTGWNNMPAATLLGSLPAPYKNSWYGFNITQWYNGWQLGTYPNYGFMFGPRGINNQFSNFYSSDYADSRYRPYLKITYTDTSAFKLLFPLEGKSPYTTRVVATFDNDRVNSGVIKTYNGQIGLESAGKYVYAPGVVGFYKDTGGDFNLPFLNYDDEKSTSRKKIIFYDNHSGYDYAPSGVSGLPVLAAAEGTLIITSNVTSGNGANLWRNSQYSVPGNTYQWDSYHAFCILHKDGYSSWYVHCSDLSSEVKSQIMKNGYAQVKRGQTVGYVGSYGTNGAHLHFGLRKGDTLIDPYGNGSRSSVLWELTPP